MAPSGQLSIVILAARADAGAAALAGALHRRGADVIRLDGSVLARGLVRHRPDSGPVGDRRAGTAPAEDRLQLPRGVTIDANTNVVLCRLPMLAAPRFADARDQEYAESEIFALALSWLHGLGDAVVNPPSPHGLAGGGPDLLRLHRLSAGVGLRAAAVGLRTNGAAPDTLAGDRRSARRSAWHPPRPPARAWQRWDGAFIPVTAAGNPAHATVTSAGGPPAATGARGEPPLPMPTITVEPTRMLPPTLVCGDVVVGAPTGLERQTRALVRAAGLVVAEVGFGVADVIHPGAAPGTRWGGEPVVLGVDPVPGLRTPVHVEAMAAHIERRAHAVTIGAAAMPVQAASGAVAADCGPQARAPAVLPDDAVHDAPIEVQR